MENKYYLNIKESKEIKMKNGNMIRQLLKHEGLFIYKHEYFTI